MVTLFEAVLICVFIYTACFVGGIAVVLHVMRKDDRTVEPRDKE